MTDRTPSLEELLRDTRRVSALAADLVDIDVVDDAIQDLRVRAIERRIVARQPFAWVARAIRNRARSLAREARRRTARERVAARPEAEPATLDAIERQERLTQFAAELCRLPDDDRELLWRRFVDGVPPRVLAAESGSSVDTVRKRIQRARQCLAARLRARWGDEWRAVCAVLAIPRPGVTACIGTGFMTMTGKKAGAIAGLLAMVSAVGWWLAIGPADATSPTVEAPPERGGIAASGSADPTPGAAPARRQAEDRASAQFLDLPLRARQVGFTGRVVRAEDGAPVPRAAVQAAGCWLWTDADGRFTWLHRDERRRAVTFVAAAPGCVGRPVEARATTPPREVTLQLARRATVRVQVLDAATEQPVASVPVRLDGAGTSLGWTGTDGVAELGIDAPPAAPVDVTVQTLFGPVWGREFELRVVPDGSRVHQLRAERYPRHAVVRAVDAATGRPLVAATLRQLLPPGRDAVPVPGWEPLDADSGAWPGMPLATDGVGRATVALDPGVPFVALELAADGYLASGCVIVADDPDGVHEIGLYPLEDWPVRVVVGGAPPPRPARVRLRALPALAASYRAPDPAGWRPGTGPSYAYPFTGRHESVVWTDAAGAATLRLPRHLPESFWLAVEIPDGPERVFGTLMRRDLPEPPWIFEVDPGDATIAVHVLDAEGRPAGGVAVHAERWAREDDPARAAAFYSQSFVELGLADVALTDLDGRTQVQLLRGSRVSVTAPDVDPQAGATATFADAERDGVTLRFPAPRDGTIEGRVVPHTGGFPEEPWQGWLAVAYVDPVPGEPSPSAGIRQDGTFTISKLRAGRVRIQADAPGFEAIEAEVGARGLLVAIPPIRPLEVHVVDDLTGAPVHASVLVDRDRLIGWTEHEGRCAGYVRFAPAPWLRKAVVCEAYGYETARVELAPEQTEVTVRMRRKP